MRHTKLGSRNPSDALAYLRNFYKFSKAINFHHVRLTEVVRGYKLEIRRWFKERFRIEAISDQILFKKSCAISATQHMLVSFQTVL